MRELSLFEVNFNIRKISEGELDFLKPAPNTSVARSKCLFRAGKHVRCSSSHWEASLVPQGLSTCPEPPEPGSTWPPGVHISSQEPLCAWVNLTTPVGPFQGLHPTGSFLAMEQREAIDSKYLLTCDGCVCARSLIPACLDGTSRLSSLWGEVLAPERND